MAEIIHPFSSDFVTDGTITACFIFLHHYHRILYCFFLSLACVFLWLFDGFHEKRHLKNMHFGNGHFCFLFFWFFFAFCDQRHSVTDASLFTNVVEWFYNLYTEGTRSKASANKKIPLITTWIFSIHMSFF